MMDMKLLNENLIGKRIFKTGLSAFITAWICQLFGLPALFAVITAIVTIEPTASDSIKKGIIRFPAATIGAGFAMLFESLLAQSAMTYALSATFTIWICQKLRLDAGTLVATLTAVAMIPGTSDHYLTSFVVRLATTLIGITVSTMINYFILPPKFYPLVMKNLNESFVETGKLLTSLLEQRDTNNKNVTWGYTKLRKKLDRTFQLANYEREEWKYHHRDLHEIRHISHLEKRLTL
jgi:uncharacterized membrane protein YgaE (UPF0421/DUF939 family)